MNSRLVYYLHRLQDSLDGNTAAPQPVYFVCEHHEMGQHSDRTDSVGPFGSLGEVVKSLTSDPASTFTIKKGGRVEFDPDWDEAETAALKEGYFAARDAMQSR